VFLRGVSRIIHMKTQTLQVVKCVSDKLYVHNYCTCCTGVSQDSDMLFSLVVSPEQQIVWESSCKYSKCSACVQGRLPAEKRGGCI